MPSAQLIVTQPGHEAHKLDVSGALVSIGRKSDNTLCLASDSNVSKYHAVIESRGGEFWLSDLGSSNGTTVNDTAVKAERQLADGDLICFGGTSTIEFRLPPAEEQQTSAAPAAAVSLQSSSTAASADVAAASAVTPSSPPPAQKPGSTLPLIIAAVVLGGLVVTGVLVAVLYGTGVLGGKSGASAATPTPTIAQSSEDEEETADSEATPTPFEEMVFEETPSLTPTPPVSPPGIAASTDATAMLANTLAVQISQKSFYKFDPAFVALINKYIGEYRSASDYYERAAKHREAIDREFMNAQGIQPPLIGYVMAMSRTKFEDKGDGSGVWALPSAVLSEAGVTNTSADPAVPTRAAALYTRELLDMFGKDDFMYVVACYGMTLEEAGKFEDELGKNDPGRQNRYDFWKMKTAGVVSGQQAERVARFFAAGIVGENPKEFGLPADKKLSSL
ncbi:MAG TPA: FHA domain-containing protein [Pyrinomonadaceae bacterium]|nr:FHA domain-containing protein [Pyrinomonadaceae bacterium]